MFVELYRTKLEVEPGLNGKISDVGIISTNSVVNVDAIRTICMIPTTVDGKNYYRVRLVAGATEYKDTDGDYGKVYITDRDFERLIH